MTLEEAETRYIELKDIMARYSHEYYVLDRPSVSDAIYDGLMQEVKNIEKRYPQIITFDSPTQRVGGQPVDSFKKVEHSTRMLSLNDVFGRADVEAWIKRMDKLLPSTSHEFFCDVKMDGLACALVYQDGQFIQAITRGDGFVGEDVTSNVKTISNVPLRLRSQKGLEHFLIGRTEIRGEIIMFKKDFDELNRKRETEGLPTYANPRNTAAGTIRQLNPQLVAERPLRFHAYDLIRDNPEEVPTYRYAYDTLRNLGVFSNKQASVFKDIDQVIDYIEKWEKGRHKLNFNTDGLVVKVNDRSTYQNLGVVGKNPRGAVAYKYPAEEATSVVKKIIISLGRTGAATPVAVLDPVVVAGSRVQHASLHNSDEIERKDIRVGDTVVIYKAGDIIPQIRRVIIELRPKGSKRYHFETELKRQFPDLEFERPEGEAVYRMKGDQSLLLSQNLTHFASKSALDINTLGDKNVEALVASGLVQDIADIYALKKENILQLERFADISAEKLIDAVQDKKNPTLSRFLYGLGIRHVGVQTAIDLANHFKRLDSIGTASLDDLRSVEGIGDIVADSIILWFEDEYNRALLAKFRKLGVWPQEVRKAGGKLMGISIVVTGTLESMGRDIASERIRDLGGTFQTAVSKDTDYLVAGKNTGQSKLKKANTYGTKIIDEREFLQLLNS